MDELLNKLCGSGEEAEADEEGGHEVWIEDAVLGGEETYEGGEGCGLHFAVIVEADGDGVTGGNGHVDVYFGAVGVC